MLKWKIIHVELKSSLKKKSQQLATQRSNLDNKSPKEWSNQQPKQRRNKNNKHKEATMQLPRFELNLGGNSNWTQALGDEGSRRGLNFHGRASLALPPTIIATIGGGPISSSFSKPEPKLSSFKLTLSI